MDAAVGQAGTAVKVLLVCGILASALHFAADRLAGALWSGYDFFSQSMSELLAAGAPTRSVAATLDLIAGLLMVAFAVGVWMVAESTAVRLLSAVLMASTVIGMVATAFFPIHPTEAMSARPNMTNTLLMAVSTVVLWSIAIIVAAIAFSGWFRYYSIATLIGYALLTTWGLLAPSLMSEPSTVPTTGVQERTMGYVFLLWVALLAVYLLQAVAAAESVTSAVASRSRAFGG